MRTWKLFQANSVIINIGANEKVFYGSKESPSIYVRKSLKYLKLVSHFSILQGPVTFYPVRTPLLHLITRTTTTTTNIWSLYCRKYLACIGPHPVILILTAVRLDCFISLLTDCRPIILGSCEFPS